MIVTTCGADKQGSAAKCINDRQSGGKVEHSRCEHNSALHQCIQEFKTQLQYNSALHQCSLHHQRLQEFKTQLQYTTTVHVEENATLETRCTESVSSKANCTRRRRTPVQRKTVQHSVEHVHCTAVLLHLCSACGERCEQGTGPTASGGGWSLLGQGKVRGIPEEVPSTWILKVIL